jgi:hypothetical protein
LREAGAENNAHDAEALSGIDEDRANMLELQADQLQAECDGQGG